MPHELRCDSHKLHGIMINERTLEVSCRSRWCGWRRGVVIRHQFDIRTGQMTATHLYRDPSQKGTS